MIPKALDERSLVALVHAGAVREVLASREGPEGAYSAAVRVGVRWVPIRAQRAPVRLWRSLDALAGFCDKVGIQRLSVEL
jgi:hypothetical protein